MGGISGGKRGVVWQQTISTQLSVRTTVAKGSCFWLGHRAWEKNSRILTKKEKEAEKKRGIIENR